MFRLTSSLSVLGIFLLLAAPLRADVFGGIEIGGKGVKATVLEVIPGEDLDVKVKFSDTTNTAMAAGIAKTGSFDPAAVAETAKAVATYRDKFVKEFAVEPAKIFIVGSSGLFAAVESKPDVVATNRATLAAAVKQASGSEMSFIDVKKESELSIVGTMPKRHRATGLLVDIGSGNTKGGYATADGATTFGVPFGTITFSEAVAKTGSTDPKSVAMVAEEQLFPALKTGLGKLALTKERDTVVLSGGIAYVIAAVVHPGDARPYCPLTLAEIEAFEATLKNHPEHFPEPDLSKLASDELRKKAAAELARAKKVYTPQQLLAGTQVLKGVVKELSHETPRKFFFARHGYLGWILAYVTENSTTK